MSWDRSRSRATGLLCTTWRLKSKFITPLQNKASSRAGKEENQKLSYNLSVLRGGDARPEHVAHRVPADPGVCLEPSSLPTNVHVSPRAQRRKTVPRTGHPNH